ncbi:midasin [Telopea speciosissima]|uniref:midasin n=1 Tax=Telopea speciosissima TaxID=54955 RepID=UPI001CC77F94|nr:midasin [Telopea speciosissima]
MAIDGSFSLQYELDRFLTRCPKLRCIPGLQSLSQKGDSLTEEEVVNSLAELFLHPNYTIPMMGCFRPVARKIVDRAVALLRLVQSLKLDSEDTVPGIGENGHTCETGNCDVVDDVIVIDLYVRSGRCLKLHELASLAFCRALELAPFLLGSVLNYFKFAPPPFQRLLATDSTSQLIEKEGTRLLNAVRTSYRFLLLKPNVFSELWNWSCFMNLVQHSPNVGSGNNPELLKVILDIKWCGIQILSNILRMSDRATSCCGLDAENSFSCLLRWDEFCEDVSVEKASWYLERTEQQSGDFVDGSIDFDQEYCLQSFGLLCSEVSSLEPLSRNRRLSTLGRKLANSPFVLTSAVKKSFEMVLLAVSQKWPVLLYGSTGSGKTALISKLAQVSGNKVLFIHMDEHMDGKTLIGSDICSEIPGEFRWQPGSLSQAVLHGLWVVFEGIDKAPLDVQSILLPLLEGTSSFVTGRGEAITVSESFRLFATMSIPKHDSSHNSEGRISLSVLWRKVMIGPSSNKDLLDIVNIWYPKLETIVEKLIETFERVNAAPSHQRGGFQVGNPASSGSFGRFSLRDLIKWCKRITGLGFSFVGPRLSAYECKSIYKEAVDIFASSSASSENRLFMMREIAKILEVPVTEAERLLPLNKPIIQDLQTELQVGRISLKCSQLHRQKRPFVDIRSSLHVLEKIACSVKYNEPVLLIGETGTGKTTLVQNLAMRLGQPLTVLNLSQQSDVADLLGGFKPTDARFICIPLYNEFLGLFSRTFSVKENEDYLVRLGKLIADKKWKRLLNGFQRALIVFFKDPVCEVGGSGCGTKRKRPLAEELPKDWKSFSIKLDSVRRQIGASTCMAFSFVEGAFVTALRKGHWILFDEVNLAPPEMLQRIIGVLEGDQGSICLTERGDVNYIDRHPDFRIFACMNPATDAGKRDLPYFLRNRFTEYFVDDVLDDEDLCLFVNQFMDEHRPNRELVNKVVQFYKAAKKESQERLQDGANQKPQYSLRSLYRALEYTKKAEKNFGFRKALYDGFCMFFLTMLDGPSAKLMNSMLLSYLLGGDLPPNVPFDGYLVNRGNLRSDAFSENYILTRSVKEHLMNLARAVLIKRYPVLLQGPTSSGKTSLVQYLCAITGHEFVRINNHEHTDLQEYLGSYITDNYGKLVFQEGVLVKAVRNGYCIVLDELNLAPSDVLEALNRLLDDNRELFVPELQETVTAHPDFMLFATQNPPTFYGGRKMLSRAFRNRFVEIHVDEIPENELGTILEKRCKIPESYAKQMIDVMKDLQVHRQSSKIFAGKHGFITPRDLFRWADRFRTFGNSHKDLAEDGYFLLAERLRDENEKKVVEEILKRHVSNELVKDDLYMQEPAGGHTVLDFCKYSGVSENLGNIVWTKSMWRLYFLLERCYKMREPVLLVGETGGGKTTVCQLLSIILGSKLHILNCHQYTETSDFLGGFYPVRERSRLTEEFKHLVDQLFLSKTFLHFPRDIKISSDISQASSTLDQLSVIINSYRQGLVFHPDVTPSDLDTLEKVKLALVELHQKWQTIFTWQDGPLVQAMKDGNLFLVDEISLADDSVLERLNSVLESERKLSLAEKGGSVLEEITAHPSFFLLATMNPGGDYGKKELSPALRNRFTEIWVPSVSDINELRSIAVQRFVKSELLYITDPMLNFWEWFNQLQTGRMLTVRDILSWVDFINVTEGSLGSDYAFMHGAFLVLLDGLSLGSSISREYAGGLREICLSKLLEELKMVNTGSVDSHLTDKENYGWGDHGITVDALCANNVHSNYVFGIDPFYITKGNEEAKPVGFEFLAPTTRRNTLRLLRAMQLAKPVLLEGSPGVGKTSLIIALGKFSGHKVVRINLSEQTDVMDLLGSDLPVECDEGMKFAWSDGILLQALKSGSWVLLDELNLAPQSVLEGLNAILDHRAEVFIPELGCTFKCPPSFRVFACQNPSSQGGGRKGLPKSFLNRFTKVYVDELVEKDYLFISNSLFPTIPRALLSKLILFNKRLYEDTMVFHKYGQDGSPWEFNLRDVIRSCQIIEGAPEISQEDCFLNIIYVQRMRTAADRREVMQLYEEVFGLKPSINPYPGVQIDPQKLIVGNAAMDRNRFQPSKISESQLSILPGIRNSLEATLQCVQNQWLCILVGPSSSGKTSLVRLLAELTGNVLNELNLSSATDISELIGCFEQYNAFRSFRNVIAQVEQYISEYCSLNLESSMRSFLIERKNLLNQWLAFLCDINCSSLSSYTCTDFERWNSESYSLLGSLVKIIEQLKLDLQKYQLPVSCSWNQLDQSLEVITNLQKSHSRRPSPAKFEWIMGLLVKAIENGEWIVLENANLCNPTVLDRINSLVESSGSITINERGLVDDKPMVLHPHHKFRMFLTVNPQYGEVSRAMRNRGVEIFMMQPDWLLDGKSGYDCKENVLRNVKRFLVLAGIPVSGLVDAMAEAHMYASNAALCLGMQITLLELTRWVQLFQQLLMNGNRPVWSLQLSWEHTYLSSLGEAEGLDIVTHGKLSYFSASKLYKLDTMLGHSLSLPGGWPAPHKLRNFICYSKEACIKQNCMYLEFLGTQCAAYEFSIDCNGCLMELSLTSMDHIGTKLLIDGKQVVPSVIPFQMLKNILFPKDSNELSIKHAKLAEFDLELVNKMLYFAAKWTLEQATETDLNLYLFWFKWYSSIVEPYCHFFRSFLNLLERLINHSIWNCIIDCRRELSSHCQIDLNMQPLPILSLKLMELTASNRALQTTSGRLFNAIQCISLLQLSFQQWNTEGEYNHSDETRCLVTLLVALQELETKVLDILMGSPSFDLLFQLSTNLLEDHTLFWKGITSFQIEYLLISWRSLRKDVLRLQKFFPKEVNNVLVESRNLARVSSWGLHSPKSMLWLHGGHPFLPSSADVYCKLQQLLCFCELVWPVKIKFIRTFEKKHRSGNEFTVESVVSSNKELRFLAMQGVCMASYFSSNNDQSDIHIVQQLEEMYQMLLGRVEHEKQKLVPVLISDVHASAMEISSVCCSFCPEILCTKSGFNGWQEILPIIDRMSFFLDLELLEELSKIVVVDANEQYQGLSHASKLLEFALNFSLSYSSRPPTDFLPHQRILWTLDAWTSVESVSTKIGSFVLETWFRWHSSLWIHSHQPAKIDGYYVALPYMLFQPTVTATLGQILCSTFSVRDYPVHCLKLRVASGNLWQSSPPEREISSILWSTALSLFQQIIFAHRKSFEGDKFSQIKSILCSIRANTITEDNLQTLCLLIASSSHSRLTSLKDSFVDPLLRELCQNSSHGFLYNLGCAWFHLGGLRFHLLLNSDDIDPAIKYSLKLSQVVEKIALLECEIEVRRECEHLAGKFSMKDEKATKLELEKLELEKRRLQRKIVFRPDPAKFRKLKSECDDYMGQSTSAVDLVKNLGVMNSQQLIAQACNWQETATKFINRLSDEYIAYIDIIQPIQVAVFEMKLGMSLAVSSALQKEFLNKVVEDNFGHILETVYSFMQFPRSCVARPIHFEANLPKVLCCDPDHSASTWAMDMNLLKKLLSSSRHNIPDKTVSALELDAAFYHNMLVQVTVEMANSLLIDNTSFSLLDEIFDRLASMWMDMKVQTKAKEDEEAQQYKFRPRAFKIEDILEVDISTLKDSFLNESLCAEWQEMVAELTEMVPTKEHETLKEEWNHVQESILMNMVHIHNRLFGSVDLVKKPGNIQISDAERLLSFMDSYRLGTGVLRELHGMLSSSLDAKLIPEHLLYLCLEHDKKFGLSRKPDHIYNIYKDSNAPMMAKMVKPLTNIQQRILSLLNEWPDHPALQKVRDITEMLLSIPLITPLTKVLSGLQFLLSRAWILQENSSKFSLSDQLEPIFSLMSSWQRMEFDSWPALLDGVQEQYEINAAKLWFPLYLVLHRGHSADIAADDQYTIESLEEFIQTSSIGEFMKRLQLLFAFHGQINTGVCLKYYSSPCMIENLIKILYNVFGYYVQFQPIVLEHIDANRRNIETELKELLKLSRWEHCESHLLIETSKRTRQKLRKLIQKFNDVLQEPLMDFLTRHAKQRGIKTPSTPGPKLFSDISDKYGEIVMATFDMTQFSSTERPIWYTDWRKMVDFAVQNLQHRSDLPHLSFEDIKLGESFLRDFLASKSSHLMYEEEWTAAWLSLEKICRTATECADLWKDGNRSPGKRRALSNLLKLLESCGLSRHKSVIFEADRKSEQTSRWFLQPSYDSQHLLLAPSGLSSGNVNSTASSKFLPIEDSNSIWKMANQYYYKSIASVKLLRQICLNFHKDFSLEQVNRSASFLDHLIAIQQEQRSVAYLFAGHLKSLRRCMSSLKHLDTKSVLADHGFGNECFVIPNQHATQKSLWQQKQLFDNLCNMSYEVSLLLGTVDNTHSNTCQSIKVAINSFLLFIEKFIPDFQKSKESLDHYLLGDNGSVTTPAASLPPFIISRQMEELVMHNFQVISTFECHVRAFCSQTVEGRSVKEVLLGRFGDIFNKAKVLEESHSVLDPGSRSISAYEEGNSFELDAAFAESFKKTYKMIMEAFEKLGNGYIHSEGSTGSLTLWKTLFESLTITLQLDLICDEVAKTISYAGKLVNHAGYRDPNLCSQVGMYFNHLHGFLDLICGFGDGLLLQFLTMHRAVAEMTHMLTNLFASLYSEGFGTSAEEQEADTCGDNSKNASGTGMGEGAGLNDVSDQIDDEDQLLGTSEKPNDELDASKEVPSKNEKGIEMNEDFSADTYSVSEDSGDDGDEDGEDEKLESAMGETGDKGEVVDEKLWDKDEDGNPDNTNEKYESGSSVRDMDSSCREMHAKEDDAIMADESSEQISDETDKQKDEDENLDVPDDNDNMDDMKIDKETASADPSGLQLDEQNKGFEENMNTEVPEGSETMEEADPEECDETTNDDFPEDGKDSPMIEDMDLGKTEGVDGNGENDDTIQDHCESAEVDMVGQNKDAFEPGKTDLISDHIFNPESAAQPNSNAQTTDLSAGGAEAQWINSNVMQNGIAPSSSMRSSDIPDLEITMPDASKGEKLIGDQPRAQLPQPDTPTRQRMQPNPCRSVGNALEEWKERVKTLVDVQEDNEEGTHDMEDENANEYGFVSELEKGTAQTLGPATSDQIERNINNNKPNVDDSLEQKEDLPLMENEKQHSETHPVMSSNAPDLRQKVEEKMQKSVMNDESAIEGLAEGDDQGDDDPGSQSGSLVSINRSYLSEHMLQLGNLSVNDEEMGQEKKLEEVIDGMKDDGTALWRKYELRTTRLSQELAEQLRLVMEPTLASKLQGDYKTGKRINMKKVIPYIASHYRKDKIWLRRTRPNKRDYQVVVAVDDSRSMSESRCGDVATEALVTVCRAMSQLEVGKLAVASFGKKGNVRLLHDFDHPFTGEAGVKMISRLTFKQENTIADEPVVDLLKYLNNMLDAVVENARLSSGQNRLQQLILIIADGRFHEKENLKRCVRDVLNRKRMVAFLLLDSPEESIMELKEVSTEGDKITFTKYLDSFPFPYYIILKNIEALPRTLADLLRQWFELMQNTRD